MPQLPRVGDLFGRYRIDAQIGQGGMGVVFGATDTDFDRRVALKVVSTALGESAEFQARFEREASVLARLNSPHVIAIFDYGEQDGCPYIATQYVAGGDLGGLLTARGPMPPSLAVNVCAQVADALSDAHRAGVVHRDVKPSNVLLRDADTTDLHAYLCDFGIARTESEGLTAPGAVSGTWSYLAPECGSGAPGTVASDLYSLGCLLWAALTGQAPYRGTDVEIAIAHHRGPLPQLLGDDPFTLHVNAILANTLAKDPRARYADADALRRDLLAAKAIPSTGVRAAPVVASPQRSRSSQQPASQPSAESRAGGSGRLSLGSLPPGSPSITGRSARRRTSLVVALSCAAVVAVAGGIVAVSVLGGEDNQPAAGPNQSRATSPTESATESPTGSASGSPTSSPVEPVVEGPVHGDVNGDGFGDLSLTNLVKPKRGPEFYELTSWTSTGSAFIDPVTDGDPTGPGSSRDRVIGDFDGDGLLEEVAVDTPSQTGKPSISAELSTGVSLRQKLPRPDEAKYLTSFAGDINDDDQDDLVLLAWGEDDLMQVWVASSSGTAFSAATKALDIPHGFSQASVEAGDFDGDSRVDIAVITTPDVPPGDASRSTIDIYLGGAEGFVPDDKPRTFVSEIGPQLLAGDVDGNGDDELLLVINRTEFAALNVLDYQGRIRKPQPWGLIALPTSSFFDTSFSTGDFDGDGFTDVVGVGPTPDAKQADVQVALSTGDQFASPTSWAKWNAALTDSYGPDIVGMTFP